MRGLRKPTLPVSNEGRTMSNTHGMMVILWATALLGIPGCDSEEGDTGASGSTGPDMMGTSTGDMGDSTGRPTPIPPDPPADSGDESTDGGEQTGDTSTGEPPAELECEAYCELYEGSCQDFSEYANTQHCLDNCAQWPVGAIEDIEGDSLGCRTYHVTVAGTTDPELHCPHAGPSGMQVCVAEDAPTCDLYCMRYFNNCEGDLNLWVDMDECMDTCAGWYPGTGTDAAGHSIGCRSYYANLAAGNDELHCPNAGPGGGAQCVLGG